MSTGRKAMGGGVASLFNNSTIFETLDDGTKAVLQMQVQFLPIQRIQANKDQPRKIFTQEALEDLANSIKEHGILQPIVVRPHPHATGMYEIIAGERRYRAAQRIELIEVPVIVHDVANKEALVLALTENLQRENLNPMEEAEALYLLKENFGFTQDELAKSLGKTRSTIANILRLTNLCDSAKKEIHKGSISLGHAKVLLSVQDTKVQHAMVEAILRHNFSVRETEALLKDIKKEEAKKNSSKKIKHNSTSEYITSTVNKLSTQLATTIAIQGTEDKGKIVISFNSRNTLERIISVLER